MTVANARALRVAGDLKAAGAILDSLSDQTKIDVKLERFYICFQRDDFEGAQRIAETVKFQYEERGVELLSHLGLMMRRRRLHAAAAAAFTEAEQIAVRTEASLPEWFYSELSGAYVDLKSWEPALRAAMAGVALKPALGLTMATSLLKLGRLEQALEQLDATIDRLAGDSTRADRVLEICRALLATDRSDKSIQIVSKAIAAFGKSATADELRIELGLGKGDLAEAALGLSRLLASDRLNTASLLGRLNVVLRKAPDLWAQYGETFEKALLNNPDRDDILFQWQDYLSIQLTDSDIQRRFVQFQEQNPFILSALMLELAKRLGSGEIFTRFGPQIDAWRRSDAFIGLQYFLSALSHFHSIEAKSVQHVVNAPYNLLRLFFLCRTPSVRVIRVREKNLADESLLRDIGIDVERTRGFLDELIQIGSEEWRNYLDEADYSSELAGQIVRRDETFVGFQDRIVRERNFFMIDPVSGVEADCFDSVKIFDRQIFTFKGKELFLFISGGNMNFALFIYLISKNVLLAVDTSEQPSRLAFYAADRYMCEIMAVYMQRAAKNYPAFAQAASTAIEERGKPKRIIVIHGRAENPAHHIWNYLPPFERLALANLCQNINVVVPPPTEYFGKSSILYPELNAETMPLPELAAIDPCPFSPSTIGVQLGASFIPKGLMSRVRQWALTETSLDRQNWIAAHSRRFPIIWVGLRVFDKAWVSQSTGLAMMVDLVRDQYPDAVFLLDGFSRPGKQAEIPDKWRNAVDALKNVVQEIVERTAHPEAVFSLIGNTLAESVIWAEKTDVYFAPLGSSQHKVGWFSSAPGLVYTSSSLSGSLPAARPGAWESEGCAVPTFLTGKTADPGQRRSRFDYRSNLENVDFDADTAASMLLDLIASRSQSAMTE